MADYAIHDTTLTSIANTIRKKDGSSALIDPAEYAKRINLMGMLEEKTASSASVCSFSDGADDVPMSSVVAHIAPNLTGKNAVNMVHTGKNLIKPDKYQTAGNNLALGQNDGTSFGTFLKAGTYTISYETTGETCYIYRREENDASNTNMGKKLSTNFTLESDGNFRFWLYGDGATYANISNVQIEVGSTSTTYEPYSAPTTYTANLGRTVYGGQADIVSGQGIDDALWANLSDVAWTEDTNRAGVFYGAVAGRKTATADDASDVLACTCFDVNNVAVTTSIDNYISGARSYGGNIIFFRDSSMAGYTRAQVQEALQGEKVCVVSANPASFTFDGQEIPSLLGVNNLWHEDGETEAVYRSSGTVYQYPAGEGVSF